MNKLLLLLSIFIYIYFTEKMFPYDNNVKKEEKRTVLILEGRRDYARSQMTQADQAMLDQNYLNAVKYYKNALDAIAPSTSTSLSQEILLRLQQAILMLAMQDSSEVDVTQAGSLIRLILSNSYLKSYPDLVQLDNKLHHSTLTSLSHGSISVEEKQKIKKLLQEAKCSYDQECWDDATETYKKVLINDANNPVALLAIKLITQDKNKKALSIADKKKDQMILDIENAWSIKNNNEPSCNTSNIEKLSINEQKKEAISYKLRTLIIPKIAFDEIPLADALHELKTEASLLDTLEIDPNKKGVNIVIKADTFHGYSYEDSKIHLFLSDIPLGEVLKYIAQETNLKINIEPYAVTLQPYSEITEPLLIKEYKIPLHFFDTFSDKVLSAQEGGSSPSLFSAKEALLSQGIPFPKGASAHYLVDNNLLTVKNTEANLSLIQSLVDTAMAHPSYQVEIEARFLEVKQSQWQEKGLDWLLGSFTLPFGSGIHGGGGTVGHQATYHNNNYPIQQNGVPVGTIPGGPPGAGSVTSGNRLGTAAITANALDALLGGGIAPASGVLALAGVFTTPQFQVVLRALHQQKGISLISSPKVTVSSGRKATITIAREFPYPADYLPPQIPQNQGGGVNPAIPATPASFKKCDVGVQLEVEPTVGPDQSTIELKLSPQIVEFQGFVNYGSPIFSQAPTLLGIGQNNATGSTSQVLLTENNINQPVFSVRQVDTQVFLRSGQTVVLGGLMREDIQKVKDKTPFIGDLPVIGGLFRSTSQQRVKRNLLIFVTVALLDSSGKKPLESLNK